MSYQANLEIINRVKRAVFSDTSNNDLALYALSNIQRIFIGSGSDPTIVSSSSNLHINTNASINGTILPSSNDTYDLGSSTMRFRDLYLGGNSLYIANTKISTDTNSNLQIQDATTNDLQSITLKELQLGTSADGIKLKKGKDGKYKFFKLDFNNGEEPDLTLNGSVALSTTDQSIVSTTPERGYAASQVTVPVITTKYFLSTANISYGRIELGAHNNASLAPNASIQITINHNLGTDNYLVFVYPDDTTSIQTRVSNNTMNSIDITLRNISQNSVNAPCVNYQLVMSSGLVTTPYTIAAPVDIITPEINLTAESTETSFASTYTLSNLATDPQSYPVTLSIFDNSSQRFTLDPATMILTYIHSNTTTTSHLVLKARNQYVDDNTKLITITVNETRV